MLNGAEPTHRYLKSNFLDRQKRQVDALNDLYKHLNVGVEKFTSTQELSPHLSMTISQMDDYARTLERAGILQRRLEFGATIDGKYRSGRTVFWKLLVPKDEAVRLLNKYHREDRQNKDHAPAPRSTGIQQRIIEALDRNDGRFDTIQDLVSALGIDNAQKKGFHNVTHVLHSLKRQNKISFDLGSTNDKIPYNIKKVNMRVREASTEEVKERTITIVPDSYRLPEPLPVEIIPVLPKSIDLSLIEQMLNRSDRLQAAAKLAEEAGEAEIAVALYDKAQNVTLNKFEQQVKALYEAYHACINE